MLGETFEKQKLLSPQDTPQSLGSNKKILRI